MHHALLDAETLGFDAVQVFTRNQQQWKAKPLDPATVREFRTHATRLGFGQLVAHDSYLINMAAADHALRQRSMASFAEEMRRCDQLGIRYLVTHPGAHVGQGEEAGIAKMIDAYRRLLRSHKTGEVIICIETTAGQGSCLGWRFEPLRQILDGVGSPRMAVCLDTCHVFAAGYDIRTAAGTRAMLDEFDRVVGLKHLRVIHVNDSKKPLASRVDRHEHIGRGMIGLPAFGVLATDPRFARVPKILETAKEKRPTDGREWDAVNLEVLRKLAAGRKRFGLP